MCEPNKSKKHTKNSPQFLALIFLTFSSLHNVSGNAYISAHPNPLLNVRNPINRKNTQKIAPKFLALIFLTFASLHNVSGNTYISAHPNPLLNVRNPINRKNTQNDYPDVSSEVEQELTTELHALLGKWYKIRLFTML
jgi:hypothetical protein